MIDKNIKLEEIIFNDLIQKTVDIYTVDDTGEINLLKSGKIINFMIRLPFLYFTLDYKNKVRDFLLPQPFQYNWVNDRLKLSYELEKTIEDKNIVDKMRIIGNNSDSKILDRIVTIKPIIK